LLPDSLIYRAHSTKFKDFSTTLKDLNLQFSSIKIISIKSHILDAVLQYLDYNVTLNFC